MACQRHRYGDASPSPPHSHAPAADANFCGIDERSAPRASCGKRCLSRCSAVASPAAGRLWNTETFRFLSPSTMLTFFASTALLIASVIASRSPFGPQRIDSGEHLSIATSAITLAVLVFLVEHLTGWNRPCNLHL